MWFKARILCVGAEGTKDYGSALEPCCYEVIRAGTLDEALRLAKGAYFNLYLISQGTFESSGREFCRRVRTFDQNTPILFSVESAISVDKQVTKRAGGQECIHKSAELWELEQSIVRLISQAEAKRQERLRREQSRAPRPERSRKDSVLRTVA